MEQLSTWKGKQLVDMSRDELIEALHEMNELYQHVIKDRLV